MLEVSYEIDLPILDDGNETIHSERLCSGTHLMVIGNHPHSVNDLFLRVCRPKLQLHMYRLQVDLP